MVIPWFSAARRQLRSWNQSVISKQTYRFVFYVKRLIFQLGLFRRLLYAEKGTLCWQTTLVKMSMLNQVIQGFAGKEGRTTAAERSV